MMEIPAEKYCYERDANMKLTGRGCPFSNMYESDAGLINECGHPDFGGEVEEDGTALRPLRCPACLAAYPNGATVTITPKGKK